MRATGVGGAREIGLILRYRESVILRKLAYRACYVIIWLSIGNDCKRADNIKLAELISIEIDEISKDTLGLKIGTENYTP